MKRLSLVIVGISAALSILFVPYRISISDRSIETPDHYNDISYLPVTKISPKINLSEHRRANGSYFGKEIPEALNLEPYGGYREISDVRKADLIRFLPFIDALLFFLFSLFYTSVKAERVGDINRKSQLSATVANFLMLRSKGLRRLSIVLGSITLVVFVLYNFGEFSSFYTSSSLVIITLLLTPLILAFSFWSWWLIFRLLEWVYNGFKRG